MNNKEVSLDLRTAGILEERIKEYDKLQSMINDISLTLHKNIVPYYANFTDEQKQELLQTALEGAQRLLDKVRELQGSV